MYNKNMLWIYSLAHFCVDFSCAFFIYSRFLNPWQWTLCLVLYNFCAFAMQAPLGLLGDRINKNAVFAAAGCVITRHAKVKPARNSRIGYDGVQGKRQERMSCHGRF